LRILIVEDDIVDRKLLERLLSRSSLQISEIESTEYLQSALELLDREDFDVILLDLTLPDSQGTDSFTAICEKAPDVPVIVLSGLDDIELAVTAVHEGIQDYLVKGQVDQDLLARAVNYAIERKRTQKVLDQKQRNIEAIFDAAPVGMMLIDEHLVVKRVNHTVKRMTRRDYPEIIGLGVGGALGCVNSGCDRKGCGHGPNCTTCSLKAAIVGVFDSGRPVHNLEVRLTVVVEGEKVVGWLRVSAEPVSLDGVRYVVVALDDVTERKEADRKLRAAEERYRTIFENSAVGITLVDEQERLISWNRMAETILGMTAEDLYLRSVRSLYPADEWDKIRAQNLRRKGMRYHVETKMLRKDGSVVDVDLSLSVLKNAEGKTTGSVGVFTDVTERRQDRERIERSLSLLHATLESTADGILVVDNDRRVAIYNRKFVEIWRIPEEILQTRDDRKLLESALPQLENPEEFLKRVEELYDQPEAESSEIIRFKDGRVIHRYSQPQRVGGEVRGRVWSFRDITESKRAEEKLKETMEMKSQFISTISHELRTPLASMKESVSIVLEGVAGPINDDQKHFLDIAKRNIDRLARLINDVLDFQKLGSGKMQFNIQQHDVAEVVDDACRSMATFAEKRGVKLSIKLAEDLPKAVFDSDRIIQVLTNLINNAIKFTPKGGQVSVDVRVQGPELVFQVSDTGMGIPKEALPKIFERFYRVQRPGKEIGGTGLGLAIVNRIVTAHGGRIEVESELNKGTTFTVSIPLAGPPKSEPLLEGADEKIENVVVDG